MEEKPKPIENGLPINQINRLAKKEKKAEMHYRPPLTMHKWWARRSGVVFRTILLYSLLDPNNPENVTVPEKDIKDYLGKGQNQNIFDHLSDGLWDLYTKNVNFQNITILDPFMGGGTIPLEALRLNCNVVGCDINPVAWFITKQEIEPVDTKKIENKYKELKKTISEEIKEYYKTPCPTCGEKADVMYTLWVKKLKCPTCETVVPLHKDWKIAKARNKDDRDHVLCPNCKQVTETNSYNSKTECENCGETFDPNEGNVSGKKFVCSKCGQPYNVIDRIEETGKPDQEMFAIEYYCPKCDKKGYKSPEEKDLELFEKARKKLEKQEGNLPLPEQHIPKGEKTRELLNHGYEKFKDMFNPRQLFLTGKLLDEILNIDDRKVREFFLLVFSNTLDFYNEFCIYNKSGHKIEHLFIKRAYVNRTSYGENNLWGAKYGRGSFSNQYDLIKKGKEYLKKPYDRYVDESSGGTKKKYIDSEINTKIRNSFDEFDEEGQNAMLLCKSSDNLSEVPDNSIDAVITDPPYYSNIQYSELSDFFYVWLRKGLKDQYGYFEGEYTEKEKETVVNKSRKKLDKDFERELTDLFREAKRKLKGRKKGKKGGLMVFTFSHKAGEAWSKVLKSVLDAGFIVEASYPVFSESVSGTRSPNNIDFDTIVVCKQISSEDVERIPWNFLEDQIYSRASEYAKEYKKENGSALPLADMMLVAQGACLELYSKHYPEVVEDGEKISIDEAVFRVGREVRERLIEERLKGIASRTDRKTAIYTLLLAGEDKISNDDFRKELRGSGLDVEDFLEDKLVKQNKKLHVVKPEDRAEHIEHKREITAIDKAHYLLYLYRDDNRSLVDEGEEWIDPSAVEALNALNVESDESDLKKVKKFAEDKASALSESKKKQAELEDWNR